MNDFLATNAFREQVCVNALLRGKDDRALDDVVQLTYISRPVVMHQQLHGGLRELTRGLAVFLAVASEELS